MTLALPEFTGEADLELVLTFARDYAVVQLWLDDQKLGGPIDLYDPQVVTTGVLSFPKVKGSDGEHKLTIEILGANPQAAKAFMVGVDYVRITKP